MSDLFVLYDINLQQIKESVNPTFPVKPEHTLGVIQQSLFSHMLYNSSISYVQLENLINKILQMYHLVEAIMTMFDNTSEFIKLSQLFEKLLRGEYYQKLQQQNPVWLLTNRQTPYNVKIIIAAVLLNTSKKMTLQQIKKTVMAFTLEEKKNRTNGIPLNPKRIINLLRLLNLTISVNFLQTWIKQHKFEVQNYILPHEFLYLACLCSDRAVYLHLIPKVSYRREKNPHTKLYQIQSIKEIIGTPDAKIQQKLRQTTFCQTQKETVKERRLQDKTNKKVSLVKSSKHLTKFQMLRDDNLYEDIKICLKNREKSEKLTKCLNAVKSANTSTARPVTAIHPLRLKQIVSADISYFEHGFREVVSRNSDFTPKCRSRNITRRDNNAFYVKDYLRSIVKRQTGFLNQKIGRSVYCRSENLTM